MIHPRALAALIAFALAAPALAGCIGAKDGDGGETPIGPQTVQNAPPADQQAGLGWVYGVVTDLQTNASIANVNVSLGQGLGSALTNASGGFVIPNVPRGEYVLTAKAPAGYLLSRYAIGVFADEGTFMHFKLQPEGAAGIDELEPVVWSMLHFKETPGARYLADSPGAMSASEAPEGEPATNELPHPEHGGFGTTNLPDATGSHARDAGRMVWELEVEEPITIHADTETPVEFADPSYPGGDASLVRFSAMNVKLWKASLTGGGGGGTVRVEDLAPDGTSELLALRGQVAGDGAPGLMEVPLPFLKRGKEFHTFQPGHKIRVTFESSLNGYLAYFFDGEQYPSGLDLRKGPYLEPPKAGDRIVLTYEGHTMAGASNPYGIAWFVPVPPEADPVINPAGIHRTGAGGYYVGAACPDPKASTCVGDTTVFFDVPQGAQTVYTRLEFTSPPVRTPEGLLNDYDILLYEPSGKAHTHTAGYGGNQAELQFHDVFETPEWPQKWWVEIFAFLVVEADWTCTVEIQF